MGHPVGGIVISLVSDGLNSLLALLTLTPFGALGLFVTAEAFRDEVRDDESIITVVGDWLDDRPGTRGRLQPASGHRNLPEGGAGRWN